MPAWKAADLSARTNSETARALQSQAKQEVSQLASWSVYEKRPSAARERGKRPCFQESTHHNSSSTTAAAAAAAAAGSGAPRGSPQRMQSTHTIEEIRARLRPRIQSGRIPGDAKFAFGGSRESAEGWVEGRAHAMQPAACAVFLTGTSSAAVHSLETLPGASSPLRLRPQSDGGIAAAAGSAAAVARSPQSSSRSSTAAATGGVAAERAVSVQREAAAPHFRASGADCLETIIRRRQTIASEQQGGVPSPLLAGGEQTDCLFLLHELLAFVEALEAHRQQSLAEAVRLRRYNSEMAMLLQQANAREQQLFKELQKQRSLLAETHTKMQQLQHNAEEAAQSLKTQRDVLAERLQVVETELERCVAENQQLLRQNAQNDACLRELAAMRQSHGVIEREKKQLQSELEAQAVARSRLLNERIELQGQLHRLQSRLEDVETADAGRGPADFPVCEAAAFSQVYGDGVFFEETTEEGCAMMGVLLHQLMAEVSPHLTDAQREEFVQQGAAKRIQEAFLQMRAEKVEFHGYALELLNRLDAIGGTSCCSSVSPSQQHMDLGAAMFASMGSGIAVSGGDVAAAAAEREAFEASSECNNPLAISTELAEPQAAALP
ncbi:uncharacterized protein LOC34623666 [Cyclospora cayetanensis]|uniref:Uncharacterized protein LOC34623666 n=1 Tax=Cyclospora cayetanensis TaxID=88456 RepID=A0A6P6S1Z1_9EIME|nr:uncharacterized protein LOC34623666 [Cyclospora cayetanensis]